MKITLKPQTKSITFTITSCDKEPTHDKRVNISFAHLWYYRYP
jgi:hypothetical protein